jgi:hypothetical protein
MRTKLITLALAVAMTVPAGAALGDEGNPFQGSWVGTDTDGSRNMLIVGSGNNHVVYRETGLSACLFAFGEYVGGSVAGFGVVDGDVLSFTGTLYCNLSTGRTAHPSFTDFDWFVVYDEATNSVSLGADPGATMYRPGS